MGEEINILEVNLKNGHSVYVNKDIISIVNKFYDNDNSEITLSVITIGNSHASSRYPVLIDEKEPENALISDIKSVDLFKVVKE